MSAGKKEKIRPLIALVSYGQTPTRPMTRKNLCLLAKLQSAPTKGTPAHSSPFFFPRFFLLSLSCGETDPFLRPSVDDLLRHPSIAGVSTAGRTSSSARAFRRTPRQQTTAVPYAAREQALPAFHTLVG